MLVRGRGGMRGRVIYCTSTCNLVCLISGGSCSHSIGQSAIEAYRLNMSEIPSESLDLILLSHMQQTRLNKDNAKTTQKTPSHPKVSDRKIASVRFFLFGLQVCKKTYLFAHGIGEKRYRNLCRHFDLNGVTPRVHKNTRRLPHNACSAEEEKQVVAFIQNFADCHAMPLPGRMPNMKDYSVMMLPSDMTKSGIWKNYVESCSESGIRAVGLTKFKCVWALYLPHISVMKISSDLCDTCQKNNSLIMKSMNCNENEKSERLRVQEEHLARARECREYYRSQCNEASEFISSMTDEHRNAEIVDGPIHISFDYAQNLQIPHMPQQVGPIYFKTPRKCHLFGVCCEGIPQQINYLIDEKDLTGKGVNETISYLEHYFKEFAIKARKVYLHCDNCRGQNKNNYLMQYLCMRTILRLNDNIECSFMIPYHTRFGPDWCFGLIKLRYKRSYVSSASQLGDVVLGSTTKNINVPQHVSDPDSGKILVAVCDWKVYLDRIFKKIPNITKYQHFRFSFQHPGSVFVRELPSSPEKEIKLLLQPVQEAQFLPMPRIIEPPGLSAERAWYLYEQIREHCDTDFQDATCPKPSVPKPKGSKCQTSATAGMSSVESNRESKKK